MQKPTPAARDRPRALLVAGCLVLAVATVVPMATKSLFRLMALPAATVRVENGRAEAVTVAYRACDVADLCWERAVQVAPRVPPETSPSTSTRRT